MGLKIKSYAFVRQSLLLASVALLSARCGVSASVSALGGVSPTPTGTLPTYTKLAPTDPDKNPLDNISPGTIFPTEAGTFIGKPGPTTTGPSNPALIKTITKIDVKNGGTLENFEYSGTVDLRGLKNVTIRNARIHDGTFGIRTDGGATGIVIEHVDISNVDSAGVYGDNFTVRYSNVHHSGGDGFKPGDNSIVAFNWVHHLGYKSPDAHADGAQIRGSRNVRLYGNFFDAPEGVADTKSNSALFLQGNADVPSNKILFLGNWVNGGNYGIHAYTDGGDPTSVQIVKNRFVRKSFQFGCGNNQAGVIWDGNQFDDNLADEKDPHDNACNQ